METRYAVVAVQKNPQYRFGKFLGYQTEYASLITSQGGRMTENGREQIFQGTIGEIGFREVDSPEEGEKIASRYNSLLMKGVRISSLQKITV